MYLREHGAEVLDRVLVGALGAVVFLHISLGLALAAGTSFTIDVLDSTNTSARLCCARKRFPYYHVIREH